MLLYITDHLINTYLDHVCFICKKKYKTIKGLARHENAHHKHYNIIPSNLPTLPEYALQDFRETLVYSIQKQLPLHFSGTGKRLIKFPCSESQFVGIFGDHITRYSPSKKRYECVFQGKDSISILSEVFCDSQWNIRYYQSNQRVYVVLFDGSLISNELIKQKNTPKMIIKWWRESIIDNVGHKSVSGFISISVKVEQDSF
jgi:hypothetical protein